MIAADVVASLPEIMLGEDRMRLAESQAAVFFGEGGKLLCGQVGGDFAPFGVLLPGLLDQGAVKQRRRNDALEISYETFLQVSGSEFHGQ